MNKLVLGIIECFSCKSLVLVGTKRLRCNYCHTQYKALQMRALTRVMNEKRRGRLAHPSTFKCVDCENQAAVYEHRDYSKPLDVVPTCDTCNQARGPTSNSFRPPWQE